jgi:hypothetical protein
MSALAIVLIVLLVLILAGAFQTAQWIVGGPLIAIVLIVLLVLLLTGNL